RWCVMDASCYCRDRRGVNRKYRSARRADRWLAAAPCGMWACVDGREVLFKRFYAPIAKRASPTSEACGSDTYAWVKWKRQQHFCHNGSFRPTERAATMTQRGAGRVGTAQA